VSLDNLIATWVGEAPGLIGSVIAVSVMVGFALLLGLNKQTEIDDAVLARLAAEEGASVEAVAIATNGRGALAKLTGGKILVARVMGADIGTRLTAPNAVKLTLRQGKLSVRFADTGYPPLHMKLETEPAWLAELVSGGTP